MKIAVIGAGPAGLISAKHSLEKGHEVDVFEQTGSVGGTWVLTEHSNIDQNGVPVHSSMYQGLLTNIPKEIMVFRGVSYPEEIKKSKVDSFTVLKYIQSYVKQFNLEKCCKFYCQVISVTPLPNEKWKIKAKHLKSKEEIIKNYDAVFVCNGHFKDYTLPNIRGLETFTGHYIHSHLYRSHKKYRGKKVLIVGGSFSGQDIARLLKPIVKKVVISYRSKEDNLNNLSVLLKPEIEEIKNSTIIFKDGSQEEFDEIIFCTGYDYTFPFFSKECDITVRDNIVSPLYKFIININHPTMAFIGLVNKIATFSVLEVQVDFFLSHLAGNFYVSKKQMSLEVNNEIEINQEFKIPKKLWQEMSFRQEKYCASLAKMANIQPMKPVISKLYKYYKEHITEAKNFKIVNDEDFIEI